MKNKLDGFAYLPYREKLAIIKFVLSLPAMSVMPWTRRDIGARILAPRGGLVSLFMLIACAFVGVEQDRVVCFFYSCFTLLFTMFQRLKRWREHCRGVLQDSYYLGSAGCRWWMPKAMKRTRGPEMVVEPIFFFTLGFFLHHILPVFGTWLMFAAVCLFFTEAAAYSRNYDDELDLVDGLARAGIQTEHVEKFSPPASPAHDSQGEAPIPTGLTPDMSGHVEKRRSRRNNNFSEN